MKEKQIKKSEIQVTELGKESNKKHFQIGRYTTKENVKKIILFGLMGVLFIGSIYWILFLILLPVSDLFSSMLARIQSLILERDIQMLADPNYVPDTSNTVYIIFMIIGIIGYFTIPTVTGWIIQAGGAGNFTRNVNQTAMKAGNIASAATGSVAGNITGKLLNK